MTTTGPGAVPTRPAWRRWVLAASPWVAAVALVGGGLAARTTDLPTAAGGEVAAPAPAVATTPDATRGADDLAAPAAVATMTAVAPPLPAPLQLAVLAAARAALGTAGLATTGPAPDRWPLELVVSNVTPLGDGLAVAEVVGLVIEQADGTWQPPSPRAVAVPLRLPPDGAVLGAAWPVATPALPSDPPTGRVVAEPDPSVVAALTAAGWDVAEVTAVEAVLDGLLRITVHGTAPDDLDPASHSVWLRDDPGGPLPLTPTAPPQEQP